jgi:hypothetical protein
MKDKLKDKPKKIAFFAIKLDQDQGGLFESLREECDLDKKHCSHVTLAFKPKGEVLERFKGLMGMRVLLKPKHILVKTGTVATLVFEDFPVYQEGSKPHLTIGTGHDIAPVVSNDIINAHENRCLSAISIDTIETNKDELGGTIVAAIYGKGGLTFVQNPDWIS